MNNTKLEGNVAYVFGDHFDIDMICGTKNSGESDINKLLAVAMQQYDPDFVKTAKAGDILIAGKSFGYGHPHPQGMKVMRHLGITTIIGKSFARVFFKNEIASGMTLLPCSALPDDMERGETLEIDLEAWSFTRRKTGQSFKLDEIPAKEKEIIICRGIVPYFKQLKA